MDPQHPDAAKREGAHRGDQPGDGSIPLGRSNTI